MKLSDFSRPSLCARVVNAAAFAVRATAHSDAQPFFCVIAADGHRIQGISALSSK